jgi:hypothetical protein
MSEKTPGANEEQGKPAQDAASPSRRRVLKAAAAAAPIILSIKSRPAFAGDCDTATESCNLSNNLSRQPNIARG